MSITFTVTCDTDSELAKVLNNLTYERALSSVRPSSVKNNATSQATASTGAKRGRKPGSTAGASKAVSSTKSATAGKNAKAVSSKTAKSASSAKSASANTTGRKPGRPAGSANQKNNAIKLAKPGRPAASSKNTAVAGRKNIVKAQSASGARPGRKPGQLTPMIDQALQEIMKKGKPFRSKEVTDLVMKKSPALNESSVITGVSKTLSGMSLKSEQIKDAVGRPYRLYKP